MFDENLKIWMNGTFVPFPEAKVHCLTHTLHYGSGVFEGIRAYESPDGKPYIFRGKDHIKRLFESAHTYRMHEKGRIPPALKQKADEKKWKLEVPYTFDEVFEAMKATIRENKLNACYIRPLIYRGLGAMGVNPLNNPIDVMIAVWPWGAYLGEGALENGVDICVSSWTRARPNTFPAQAKACANYMSGQLSKMEAIIHGYTEGLGLDANGLVSEGSGENIFLIKGGKVFTTPLGGSILGGITRDTVMRLFKDEMGIDVQETQFPREMLYNADELFFVGTAAEVTPIRSIDNVIIGPGKRGPITEDVQKRYMDLVAGKYEDKWGFLDTVYEA